VALLVFRKKARGGFAVDVVYDATGNVDRNAREQGRFQRFLKKPGNHREKDTTLVITHPLQGGSPEMSSTQITRREDSSPKICCRCLEARLVPSKFFHDYSGDNFL
jgi:hypothetical protein